MSNILSPDKIASLLNKERVGHAALSPYPRVEQHGPLRWFDTVSQCLHGHGRKCGSPTYCKVEGIPYCMKHALEKLNEMLVEVEAA